MICNSPYILISKHSILFRNSHLNVRGVALKSCLTYGQILITIHVMGQGVLRATGHLRELLTHCWLLGACVDCLVRAKSRGSRHYRSNDLHGF